MNNDTPADAMELKTCPFCGSEAEIERYGTRRQSTIYQCTSCGCQLETGEEWGHGADWNKRTTSLAAQDGLVEALRNALKLAANRFDRLGVNAIAAGRNAEAHEISDWSQEARASARAALASIEVKSS